MFVVYKLGWRVGPNIFGLMFMGCVVLFICTSCVLYSVGTGVKRVSTSCFGCIENEIDCVHV